MKTTLYKKDSRGKIRFWTIWSEGTEVKQEYGLLDTDSPTTSVKKATAKNVGKSNETTPEEQAQLEVARAIEKKLDMAYFRTPYKARNNKIILPMRAKNYEQHKRKIDWSSENVFVQPKLDGMRCLAINDDSGFRLISRQNKEIKNMDHIKEDISLCVDMDGDFIIDGELYCHDLSFQEIMKRIKKYRSGESERIKFWMYDFHDKDNRFAMRYLKLSSLNWGHIPYIHCKKTPTYRINSELDLMGYHSKFIVAGYEGSMLRHGAKGYKNNGRCDQLLKVKDFIDICLPVKDVVAGDQRPEEGFFLFENDAGTFTTGMRYTHEQRVEFLLNKEDIIGRMEEIRFFEYTDDGIPRFPVSIGQRLDK